MRISDWSSDVCSSDLRMAGRHADVRRHFRMTAGIGQRTAAGKGTAGAEIGKVRHCARNGRQRRARMRPAGPPSRHGGETDRKSVGEGTRVAVRVDLGGRPPIEKKNNKKNSQKN